jgi:hypothetical protein
MTKPIEGEDYHFLPDGRLVWTAGYLLKRGYCCGNGCRNCPYAYEQVPEPKRSILLAEKALRDEHENRAQ